ncbi:MAG: FKBP-type peptidyl-prolyl cis-trans isomerase [Prevotellaceae bacterium]|nr:FKBP-type peptidyl-prolyl cis-trans isomerase [Prevotellaceae bacterium]
MKKILFAMAAGVIMLSSCGNGTPSAKLSDNVDSLSYLFGAVQAQQGLREFVMQQLGDSTLINDFIKGVNEGAAECSKSKQAYLLGLQIGSQVKNQMMKQINYQITGNDSTDVLKVNEYLAAFCAVANNEDLKLDPAKIKIDSLMNVVKSDILAKDPVATKNKADGEKFMKANAQKEGVVTLPSGVQYKVITAGTGAKPTKEQTASLKYEGKLIDGTVFDSNWDREEPTDMPIAGVIPGFSEALQQMPAGSEWEIYIPQELAYGANGQGAIKPFSTLIFKVKLIEVK